MLLSISGIKAKGLNTRYLTIFLIMSFTLYHKFVYAIDVMGFRSWLGGAQPVLCDTSDNGDKNRLNYVNGALQCGESVVKHGKILVERGVLDPEVLSDLEKTVDTFRKIKDNNGAMSKYDS